MIYLPETPLVFPEGLKPSCLPRTTLPGKCEWAPPLEDNIDVIPQNQWDDYGYDVELHHHVKDIHKQTLGSCATEACSGSVETKGQMQGLPFVSLNPHPIYYIASGGRDMGSNVDTVLRLCKERGFPPDVVWPRKEHNWREKPPQSVWDDHASHFRIDEVYDLTSIAEVGTALLRGFLCPFGWRGHSCYLLRLLNDRQAEYVNSWGADWGTNGRGVINLSSINFGYGAYAVRSTRGWRAWWDKYAVQYGLAA